MKLTEEPPQENSVRFKATATDVMIEMSMQSFNNRNDSSEPIHCECFKSLDQMTWHILINQKTITLFAWNEQYWHVCIDLFDVSLLPNVITVKLFQASGIFKITLEASGNFQNRLKRFRTVLLMIIFQPAFRSI